MRCTKVLYLYVTLCYPFRLEAENKIVAMTGVLDGNNTDSILSLQIYTKMCRSCFSENLYKHYRYKYMYLRGCQIVYGIYYWVFLLKYT